MSTLRLKYIHTYKDRHGKFRSYFRRAGQPRVLLPGLPGSEEFMAAYQAALKGIGLSKQIGQSRTAPGSINFLIVSYYQSADFSQLALATKATYRGILERFRHEHGDKPFDRLEARHIRDLLNERAATPSAANNLLSMIKLLMRHAMEQYGLKSDPTVSVRKLRIKSAGFLTWSDTDIEKFEARWPLGTRANLAMNLLLYTAQRRSDVVRMGRQHLQDGMIKVTQQKTKTTLLLPMPRELNESIAACPNGQLTFLTTAYGKPFSAAGFTNWFVDCAKSAGLSAGHTPHGLRKAAARRLAEAGCSAHEIMSITGHKNLREVTTYTQAANQADLAKGAMAGVARAKKTKNRTESG